MPDLAGIPMYSKDRDMDFPLLVCGGPCAFNVEPIADFFDIVSLGESEEWGDEFIDLYKAEKQKVSLVVKRRFYVKWLKFLVPIVRHYMMWNIQSKAILNLLHLALKRYRQS